MSKSPKKTENASRVLQLMDSSEHGEGRYGEFVKLVANDANISIAQLEQELDPFI
jgi:hypothetical protein